MGKSNYKLNLISDEKAVAVFQNYDLVIQEKLNEIRTLIIEAAEELELPTLEETTKWGEPSYIAKKGSTIRVDWKAKSPKQYQVYFKCTSRLVDTFKAVYGDLFRYEKSRAIIFQLDDQIPVEELKSCLKMALQYHKVKHLPLLGA